MCGVWTMYMLYVYNMSHVRVISSRTRDLWLLTGYGESIVA